jgi:hypothetical protein
MQYFAFQIWIWVCKIKFGLWEITFCLQSLYFCYGAVPPRTAGTGNRIACCLPHSANIPIVVSKTGNWVARRVGSALARRAHHFFL